MKEPLVSIIMNCHNCEQFLREAIDSVVKQTYANWELIFWDNQSDDHSSEISQSYVDSRINYYKSDSFTPLGEARDLAMKRSEGEFIGFLDADDTWFPEKLSKQVPLFENEDVGIVISDVEFFNGRGQVKQLNIRSKPPTGKVFKELLNGNFIPLETAIIRRQELNKLDHWFDNRFHMVADYDLFIRLSIDCKLGYVDEVLARWRVHANSWTWKHGNLFPDERRMMLKKLSKLVTNFESEYSNEIAQINRICAFEEAQVLWKGGKNEKARKLLRRYRFDSIKWLATYCLTWLPFSVFNFIWRLRGSIQP